MKPLIELRWGGVSRPSSQFGIAGIAISQGAAPFFLAINAATRVPARWKHDQFAFTEEVESGSDHDRVKSRLGG